MPQKTKTKPEEPTTRLVRAIGHPVRLKILEALANEVGSATSLSALLAESLATVSYHLNKVLDQECEVVEVVKIRRNRGGSERFYALKDASYIDVIAWPAIPIAVRNGLMGASLKSFLAIVIAALKAGELGSASDPSTLIWRPALVDDHGQAEISDAMSEVVRRIEEAKRRSATRIKRAKKNSPSQLIVGLAAFRPAEVLADRGELAGSG